MTCKILHRLWINAGINQVGDVSMPQKMWSHVKINRVYELWVVGLMRAENRLDRFCDFLPVNVLVDGSFLCRSDSDILPNPNKL